MKLESIRINVNEKVYDLINLIDKNYSVERFTDQDNEYLIPTGRDLIGSNTKRKRIESPRWNKSNQLY